MTEKIDQNQIPKHVAIIMDGNRRWARQHKLEALQGHEYVANKLIEPLVERLILRGVKYVTLWAFSTENWQRDPKEVEGLMNLFRQAFKKSAKRLHEQGVRLNVIGDISQFPQDIQENVADWLEKSKNNERITVTFALNYGGHDEIIRGIHQLPDAKRKTVTAEEFKQYLDTADLPDPDLIIRPGGELRLSGFLAWSAVYAELYFSDLLMPDFGPDQLDEALAEYAKRMRRFGK
jgi:undecaprenyl diphosphate synthase